MTTIVIGAGVIGLLTALELHRDGHDVLVVERREGAGLETSFGNAGGLCPGFAGPWAAPGMPVKALKWMFAQSAPLKIRPKLDPAQWRWLAAFTQACTKDAFARNKRAMQAIAHYSAARLDKVRADTALVFDHATGGVLQTFETSEELAAGRVSASVLAEAGIAHRLVAPDDIPSIEPGLADARVSFSGALHLPNDQTGDAHLFCEALQAHLAGNGVRFRFRTDVAAIAVEGGVVAGVTVGNEVLSASRVVVAAGPFAPRILSPLGVKLPLYPVKGYSLTFALAAGAGPRSSVMDEHSKLMLTRLGQRLRVAGVAELSGFDATLRKPSLDALRRRTADLFPSAVSDAAGEPWCGFRPMTPDGRPRIGPTHVAGLFVTAGHGSNGWTQAAGAGRLIADIIAGRKPEIDPAPYALN
ncbi:MAG: D-amino acid dehydrogenase [Pseudomonadota bacterium]